MTHDGHVSVFRLSCPKALRRVGFLSLVPRQRQDVCILASECFCGFSCDLGLNVSFAYLEVHPGQTVLGN